MNEVLLVTPPTAEPVAVADALIQLGLGSPVDSTLSSQLTTQITGLLLAARRKCESFTRSTFTTTTWLRQMDHWPGWDSRRTHNYLEGFLLPKPPFQSIQSFTYIDESGTQQTLALDTSYGTNSNEPAYGYQLDRGTDTRPARLLPRWASPWPPLRSVPNAVQIIFKSGFGGPVTASMAAGSAVLTGPTFNPGDVGQAVSVPGAGVAGAVLTTTIASVNPATGVATLATAATAAVASATNNVYVGQQVPAEIILAIKLMTQVFYEQGATTDLPMPRVIQDLLREYRNDVA